MEKFKSSMKGIYTSSVSIATIDEAPMAYKDTSTIISPIGDTVEITEQIIPVYNFKSSK